MKKKRLVYKIITNCFQFKYKIRWKSQQKLMNFHQNTSITRIKNRCQLTGRSKSIYRLFKLSRIQLRELASNGLLPGVYKYNW